MTQTPIREISPQTVWQLARPASLSVTAVACVLGFASAAGCGYAVDWAGAVAALLLACGFHAGVNILHTCYLAQRLGSQPAPPAHDAGPFGATTGLRLMAQGAITPAEVRQVAWALLGLVMFAGLVLAVKAGGGLVTLGLAGLLLAWAYAAPPLRLSSRGGTELLAALAWWLVVLGADYVQRRQFFLIPAVDAVSFALLVAAIPLAQRFTQAAGSRASKVHPERVNKRLAAMSNALMLLAYGWLVGGVLMLYHPQQALWGLVSLPVSLAANTLLWVAVFRPQHAPLAWQLTVAAALLHGLGMAAGLVTVAMV